jgi:hypothetical protein
MHRSVPTLACLFLLVGPLFLPALSRADLDKVIDFSVTLKSLATAADIGSSIPIAKTVLLTGTVSDVDILSKDQAGFKVRIELISGEWIGVEEVKAYSCYIEFTGAEYFRIFPARPPRAASRDLVSLNSRVLVVGTVIKVWTTPVGAKRVLLDGAYIRTIE